MIVAIDGHAGSGKGTIAKIISKKLNLFYIDTGATYRCVALLLIRYGIEENELDKIKEVLDKNYIDIDEDNNIYINDENVTGLLRSKEVTDLATIIAKNIFIREHLVQIQRNIAKNKDVIIEGRDITTVVFPNADYKFFITASLEERARRRYLDYKEKGINITLEETIDNMKFRDYNDLNKKVGALKLSEDAHYIDTTNMEVDEVVEKMINIIKE